METFTHEIDGVGELRFAHLTLIDVFGDADKPELNGFIPLYRKRKKRKMLENLRELNYSRDEQLAYLDGIDQNTPDLSDFVDFVSVPTDAQAVLAHAWKTANGDTPLPALPSKHQDEVVWKLLAPLGIVRKPQAPADAPPPAAYGDGSDAPQNPPIPPTYSNSPAVTPTASSVTDGGTGSRNAAS